MINNINIVYIILGLAVFNMILFLYLIWSRIKYRRLFKAYDIFMRGKAAQNLEDVIIHLRKDIRDLKSEDRLNKEAIRELNKLQRLSFQKLGILKYDAFEGMGGKLSFVLCLLNYKNTGYIINSIHSREGCYTYIKPVERGRTEQVLAEEEKIALEQALGYREKNIYR